MPTARRFAPLINASRARAAIESLERRTLMSISIQIDYTRDTNNFFDTPEKRALLQSAANAVVEKFTDTLDAIVPGAGNTWKAVFDHPATSGTVEVDNPTVPANTILVFAGGRSMASLGVGGPGGFSSLGTPAWNERVAARGEPGARGGDAREFGPWGGSITFDTDPSGGWYFGTDPDAIAGRSDFYSVALHEMTHLVGFGTCDSWESRVSGSVFNGPASVGEYDGAGGVPLGADHSHWASAITDGGTEVAMDPDLTTGTRKTLTALDLAGLDDVGWEIPLAATLDQTLSVTTAGSTSTTFDVVYTHYTNVDLTTLGAGDLTVSGPNGFTGPATLVSSTPADKTVTATYAIAAPGGTFDGSDSGAYSVTLAGAQVGDGFGNFAPGGSLGSFVVDIDAPPTATLSAPNVTQFGAAEHTITVAYSDAHLINVSSIDAADLTVTRSGDGLAVAVVAATPAGAGNASPLTVTYTLAGPGGAFDTDDNGTYLVTLNGAQVRDGNGTAADAGTLGSFDVSLGSLSFSAAERATFTDASGDVVTVSLKGPGSGQVRFNSAGNMDARAIVVSGTTSASALTISAAGAGTSVGALTVGGPLKSVTAKAVDLSGSMTVAGAVPKVLLRNAAGSIALNGGGTSVSVTLAQARDLGLTSASPIKSIKAAEWLDTDATPDVLTAPAISSVAVKGGFQASVTAGTIGKINTGAMAGIEIRTTGSIGSVGTPSMQDVLLFAGVVPGRATLPDSLDDFADPSATIKTISLKGAAAFFDKSRIAAGVVGKATLGSCSVGSSAGIMFGLVADRIGAASGRTFKAPFKVSKVSEPGVGGTGLLDFGVFAV